MQVYGCASILYYKEFKSVAMAWRGSSYFSTLYKNGNKYLSKKIKVACLCTIFSIIFDNINYSVR